MAVTGATLRDPAVLLLDEEMSALEEGSEQAVQRALARLSRRRTTMAIAHPLPTVLAAD